MVAPPKGLQRENERIFAGIGLGFLNELATQMFQCSPIEDISYGINLYFPSEANLLKMHE